jgi:hypothetical protein
VGVGVCKKLSQDVTSLQLSLDRKTNQKGKKACFFFCFFFFVDLKLSPREKMSRPEKRGRSVTSGQRVSSPPWSLLLFSPPLYLV